MSNGRLKVGMKVRLKEDSRYWGQSSDTMGEISRDDGGCDDIALPFKVSWESGDVCHWYNKHDLALASVIYSEDHLKEKDVL